MNTATFTISTFLECNHKKNGRWFNIDFWIFTRMFYVCYDCGDIRPASNWRIK